MARRRAPPRLGAGGSKSGEGFWTGRTRDAPPAWSHCRAVPTVAPEASGALGERPGAAPAQEEERDPEHHHRDHRVVDVVEVVPPSPPAVPGLLPDERQ